MSLIPVAIGSGRFSAWLALPGALVILAATVVDGIRHRTERGFGFSAKRLTLAASASAATSHLMFTRDTGSEGHSADLAVALHEMLDNAQKP